MMYRVLFLLLLAHLCFAHPHVFVDVGLELKIEHSKLKSVHVAWLFDEMTSAAVFMDIDKNRDKKFDQKEENLAKKEFFDRLKELDYLINLAIDGKKVHIPEAKEFRLKTDGKRVEYIFSLYFDADVRDSSIIKLSCFDKENMMAMTLKSAEAYSNELLYDKKVAYEERDYYVADVFVLKIKGKK